MKEKLAEVMWQKNYGKGKSVNDGIFANKLLKDGVYVVAEAITRELHTSRRGGKNNLQKTIDELMGEEFKENTDEIISFSISLIELVLSQLFLNDSTKYLRSSGTKAIINKLLEGDVENNIHMQTALILFRTVIEALPFISTSNDSSYVDNNNKNAARIIYTLDPKVLDEIKEVITLIIDGGYYPLPITEKPVDWQWVEDKLVGGYKTLKTKLIRDGKMSMPSKMINPIFLENTEAIEALNVVQSTAYRINKKNLARLQNDLQPPAKPELPEGFKAWRKEVYEYWQEVEVWKNTGSVEEFEPISVEISEADNERYMIYKSANEKFISDVGKYQTNILAVEIAEALKNETHIYFPHNFDYRGRMYPIPVGLNPQGNDIAKGLLEFAEPVTLTNDGINEVVTYLANVYGHDKESRKTRYKLGMKLLQHNQNDYLNAEEPYLYAQVMDLLLEINNGERESRLIINIDGSCNGLQHMSAITLDKLGGINVNVSKLKERYDIYQIIADKSLKLMQLEYNELKSYSVDNLDDKEATKVELLPELIKIMKGNKSRKIAKRPVMINPYGGSFNGYKGYVLETLKEYYPVSGTGRHAGLLTSYINTAMKEDLAGGTRYKKWSSGIFKELAKGVTNYTDSTIYFYTPDGFKVNNFQYEVISKQYKVKNLVGKVARKLMVLNKVTNKVAVRKIGTAIQPNIIHSLDATHLRMTALKMADNGENQLTFIHDSFGTNPNSIGMLNKYTRETFIELYKPNSDNHPMKLILDAVEEQTSVRPEGLEQFTGKEKMNINDVKNNEFFFA